jgi:hypothetical protein
MGSSLNRDRDRGTATKTTTAATADESDAPPTRTVCVVGLAHCNGVVARLSTVSF